MKKILLFTIALFAALTINAEQITITWSGQSDWEGVVEAASTISYSSNGISITADKAEGSNKPTINANSNDFRSYANNTVRITSEVGNMSQLVFELSNQGKKRLPDLTVTTGTVTYDVNNGKVTWTGDAIDVTFTVGAKATHGTEGAEKAGQFDFNSITVTTSGGAPTVAMPIFSQNGGSFYTPVTVELSCSTDGASIYYTLDGTTPDATKTLYNSPITIEQTTTVKAVAVKGNDVSSVNEATYTILSIPEVADIAAFLATNTTGAAKTDVYRIACPVTVIYQFDRYLYITDGNTYMQVYGSLDNTYRNGDVLTDICGSVGYYNGTYQMTPVSSTFGAATQGEEVQPIIYTVSDITEENVSQYVRINNVTVSEEKKFTDATGTIDAYKRFDVELPAVGSDTYTVEGFVSIYKTTIQIFPTKITNTTAVSAQKLDVNRVFSANGYIKTTGNPETVHVYNVTGKLVATGVVGRDIKVANKGIYIVKVGNKATKVVVR